MLTDVDQADVRGKVVFDQVAGDRRNDDLAAMGGSADTCRTVDSEADVALAADAWLPSVQAHADPELRAVRPRVGGQGSLRRHRRRHRILRAAECDEEGVTLRIDLLAAGGLERGP